MPNTEPNLADLMRELRSAVSAAEVEVRFVRRLVETLESHLVEVGQTAWSGIEALHNAGAEVPTELVEVTRYLNGGRFPAAPK